MTEGRAETQSTFIDPDGKEHPVIYDWVIQDGDKIKKFSVRIVSSNNERLDYIAINPNTQKEVRLGATHWVKVYRSLLNKEPPYDLSKKVEAYYKIREQKAKELAVKKNPIYSPLEDPEPIAA